MIHRLKKFIPQRHPLRLAWHYSKALVAAIQYGFPARKLTIIGITGTDGKTTTVGMTAHILQKAGIPTGALSTAYMQVQEERTWNETQKTSPSPFVVQKFLQDIAKRGCTHAVLEYSSHGLVQGRTHYTWPSIAAITNTSMEHLDYHGTMKQYRKDKGKLFEMLKGNGTKVLNADDETYEMYREIPSERTIVCSGSRHSSLVGSSIDETSDKRRATFLGLSDVKVSPSTSSAILTANNQKLKTQNYKLELGMPGTFNLENALCAIGCAHSVDVSLDQCVDALRTYESTPGRMELIDEGQAFFVFVDFTVTPAAYEKTLTTLREMIEPEKRILVLTGSCGDRMREKRPVVGKICSELADVVVVTNEDPYTEDPQKIIDEVWAGVDQSACEAHRIFDRREAMQFLFEQAQPGDAIILCAKGSDTTMWTAEGQIPWNEREIARELLQEME